jgi:putative component of membrane protein insertase Oxa1/YidC/SpoIIIJ protein YidD
MRHGLHALIIIIVYRRMFSRTERWFSKFAPSVASVVISVVYKHDELAGEYSRQGAGSRLE